jgi:hypothetical protein
MTEQSSRLKEIKDAKEALSREVDARSEWAIIVQSWILIGVDLVVAGIVSGVINQTTDDTLLTVIGFSAALIYCGLRGVARKTEFQGQATMYNAMANHAVAHALLAVDASINDRKA